MTKSDLIEVLAAKPDHQLPYKDVELAVRHLVERMSNALASGERIEVRGFGTFKIRRRKTRMARNPRTGDPVEVAARPVPVFKPSKELRALVADEPLPADAGDDSDDLD